MHLRLMRLLQSALQQLEEEELEEIKTKKKFKETNQKQSFNLKRHEKIDQHEIFLNTIGQYKQNKMQKLNFCYV